MIPPSFRDLGKKTRDIVDEGFHDSVLDIQLKTRSNSGIRVTSDGAVSFPGATVNAATELKFSLPQYGISFKQKWASVKGSSSKYDEDTLKSDVSFESDLLPGSKLTMECSLAPASMTRKEKLKASLKRDFYNLDAQFVLPAFCGSASATVAWRGLVLGYRVPVTSSQGLSTLGDVAIGFASEDVEIATSVTDGGDRLTASLCHKVNANLATAFVTSWNYVNNAASFVMGAEYQLDKNASFKVKADHLSRLGLAYSQTLRNGISLTVSALVDGKKVDAGDHKFGLGVTFDLS